ALTGATLPGHRVRAAPRPPADTADPVDPVASAAPAGGAKADPEGEAGPGAGAEQGGEARGYRAVLRAGLGEVRGSPRALRAVLTVSLITGVTAIDEYVPLLARDTGVAAGTVPLLVLLVTAGCVAGGLLTGRGAHLARRVLGVGAGCLAVGALSGHPAGLVLVAAAFGCFQWAMVVADARLQTAVSDRSRATVTSMVGVGSEVVAVLVFVSYALGSSLGAGPAALFAVAALPYLLIAVSDIRQ
ncbi:MFS transporter, partial [Streptomyces sparsus]